MPDLAGTKPLYLGFTGMIDPNGAGRFAAALNAATNGGYDEVHIAMSSAGGYVADGIFLYNHMKALPVRVVTYNTGSISSIAVAVFVGAAERYCSAHSMFMTHPTALFPSSMDGMPAERLQAFLNAALADDLRTENILRERTSLPTDILDSRRLRDVHITPSDAVQYGLVNAVREFSLPQGHQIIQI